MGVKPELRRARRILQSLRPADASAVTRIGRDIQRAQAVLQQKAPRYFTKCTQNCRGLCCRNVELDAIISFYDFIYILTLEPQRLPAIEAGLANEAPFFAADCPFLAGGEGPCIFADDIRPEVCITTFCQDTSPLQSEIQQVRKSFRRLSRFITFRRIAPLKELLSRF